MSLETLMLVNGGLSINRMSTPYYPLCNYIFAGWQFFVAFNLQLYSAFDDDLQSIWFYSMVMLITVFAKTSHSLRGDKLFSPRWQGILFALRKTFV